jgi:tRNA pseudouridine32 synthase/23S rRNA pseudouridine746 synthase
MQMQVVEGEPNAQTWIEIIRGQSGSIAHYRLTPRTGRKHQLRVQLAALGIPILGDRIYPALKPAFAVGDEPDYSDPLQLLAREVSFVDPITGQSRHFTSRRQLQALPGPGSSQ